MQTVFLCLHLSYNFKYDSTSNVYGKSPITKNSNKEITLQVSNVNGTNNFVNEKNFDFDSSWSGLKRTLVSGATISSNGSLTTQNISITGKYYNLTIPQTSIEGKAFTGKIYVTNHSCSTSELPGYYTILAKNTVNETIPDFSKTTTESEKGLYKADDDLGTSYYFRGAVNNNWVKFGKDSTGKDIYWRIIRVNGDGSIRMIYSGTTAPTESTKVVMTGTGTQISTSTFNSSYNNPSYVGYMYTASQQHGNSTSSTIKTTLENWYKTTTLETDSATKALVSQDQIFCNDRSVTSGSFSTSSTFYYAAYTRLNTNKKPILTCPTASDKFTSKKSSIGNKALDYPVGLITADEVAMAGGVVGTSNSTYYLYTNQYYWSGSPFIFRSSNSYAAEFRVTSSGSLDGYIVDYYYDGVRGVVSLSSKAKLSGSGTYNDVYTVS